jgi:hypothetical protein
MSALLSAAARDPEVVTTRALTARALHPDFWMIRLDALERLR